MQWLRQSTAVTVKMGPFLDSTDGNAKEEALAIVQADIRLTKNGGAYAQTNNAAGATHDENANYGVPLDTTDTGTLGTLRVHIHKSGALAVWHDFMVVPTNVWDSLFGADKLQVDLTQIGGQAIDGYNATLKLKQLDIQNSNGSAFKAKSTGGNGFGIEAEGAEGEAAISAMGGANGGHGISAVGGLDATGLYCGGMGIGHGLRALGGMGSGSGDGINAAAAGSGNAIDGEVDVGRLGGSAAALAVLKDMYTKVITTGVVSDAGPTATDFDTDLTEVTDGHYNDCVCVFTTGVLTGQHRKVDVYTGTNGNINLGTKPYTEAPANGNAFQVLGRIE